MKNLDKLLKNFLFRIGSGVAQVAKERMAPIKTGNLKRDIRVFNATSSSVQVGNTPRAGYAKFVHFGTKPYVIKAKKKRALANKKTEQIFGKKVNHPGIKANPYLINAWNIYKDGGLKRANKALAENIGLEIVKEIKAKIL